MNKGLFTLPNRQLGATLIIVLIMLLFLAIIASISIRNSQTAFKVTTAAQVQHLLMQSSDLPLAQLHMAGITIASQTLNLTLLEQMSTDALGPIHVWQRQGLYKHAEYALCYQPAQRNNLYQTNQHRILLSADGSRTLGKHDGYCHIASGDSTYYTSARKTVATQVSLSQVLPNEVSSENIESLPFQSTAEGVDEETVNGASSLRIRAVVSSVLPIMANRSSLRQIDDCFKLAAGSLAGNEINNNQIHCLNNTDAPNNIQVQDYIYHSNFE